MSAIDPRELETAKSMIRASSDHDFALIPEDEIIAGAWRTKPVEMAKAFGTHFQIFDL